MKKIKRVYEKLCLSTFIKPSENVAFFAIRYFTFPYSFKVEVSQLKQKRGAVHIYHYHLSLVGGRRYFITLAGLI